MFGDLIDWIEGLGLIAVFVLAVLDSLGLPATGDAILITAAATWDRPLAVIILAAFCGGVVGDHIAYWVGRKGGSRLIHRFLDPAKEQKLSERVDRHAPVVLVLGRLVAAVRTKAAVLSGSALLDYRRFTAYNLIGNALWATSYAILGRVVGKAVIDWLDSAGRIVFIAIGVAVVLLLAWYVRRRLRRRGAPAATLPDVEQI